MAKFSVLAASAVLSLATAVVPGPKQAGKGIFGGVSCGHGIYTRNDFKYGRVSSTCTRYIICDGPDDCHLASVDSVQACAEVAAKQSECETSTGNGFIEARQYLQFNERISHCFCNVKGKTWVPDLSHKWSNTYALIMDKDPTTTAAPTTTQHPVVDKVVDLQGTVAKLVKDTKGFMAATEKELGAVEGSILQLEIADEGLTQKLKEAAAAVAAGLQGKLDAQGKKFEGLVAAMQAKFEASLATETAARKAVEDRLAETLATLKKFTGPLTPAAASGKGCSTSTCAPEITSDGSDVTITARSGAVLFESEFCEQTDICALARDVAAVKSKFGQE